MCDQVIPISISQVAWQQYLSTSKELLGRSISNSIDGYVGELSDIAKYIITLAEFKLNKTLDPKAVLRGQGSWFEHFFLSFMILSSNSVILFIAETTSLDTISSSSTGKQRLAIISGSLKSWREAIIICCSQNATVRIRKIFNEIYFCLKKLGLSDLWYDYLPTTLSDNTFYLKHNP